MTKRIVIGDIGGAYGMKASLPGVDATTADDSNPALFAFCSKWSNVSRLGGTGYVNLPGQAYDSTTTAPVSAYVVHGIGIVPFHEVRSMEGTSNCVYDEFACLKLVDLGGQSGQYVLSLARLLSTADSNGIQVSLNPWYYQISGAWVSPSPPIVRCVWSAYVDPRR